MKFLKNNKKIIIAFILGLILAGGIVYAATSAKEVTYTTDKNAEIKNVEQALNDLYNTINNKNEFTAKKFESKWILWNKNQADNISIDYKVKKECNYVCIAIATNEYYLDSVSTDVTGNCLDLSVPSIKVSMGKANKDDILAASVSGKTTKSSCKLFCYIITDE